MIAFTRILLRGISALILALSISAVLYAQPPSHDPATMIRNNDGRYWIFTTGDGIWCMSASNPDFTDWREEPPVFTEDPAWIDDYVTGFRGNYWAPDIIKIGSTYYLYYSCAGVGAPAAIGLVTAPDLLGPWTDQGMIVAGDNAIDPAILLDGTRMWMTWGNWQSGIDICELDPATGKRLNSSYTHLVDGQVEGPALLKSGSYYYLFYQRGLCCDGVNSGYYPVVARSTSVTGPYTGERAFLPNRDGNVIGPGHIGYGENKLTYHYYSKKDRGAAKLMITTLHWGSDGWPISGTQMNPTFTAGTYKLVNTASKKYLDNLGSTVDGTNVAHNAATSSNNQLWDISFQDGYYKLMCKTGSKFLDNIGHMTDASTVGQLGEISDPSQQWFISAETSTTYHLTSRKNGKCVDTGGSKSNLDPMLFYYSNSSTNQQWTLQKVSSARIGDADVADHSNDDKSEYQVSDFLFGVQAQSTIKALRYDNTAEIETPPNENSIVAYPNPADGLARITTVVEKKSQVKLSVVNQKGSEVHIKDFGVVMPGEFSYDLDTSVLPEGMFLLRLQVTSGRTRTTKLIIIR